MRDVGAGVLAACLLVVLGLTSCVYFNTYYNAEKYFRQAEEARAKAEREGVRDQRGRTQYVTLYDKAVRKASVVLEKYPESDLIDDSMFIAGRALFWQRDYQYAMRSFRDLELNFPDSEFYDRARLWRARCLMAMSLTADARTLFTELLREGSPEGDRAGMFLGEIAESEGDGRAAVLEYRRVLAEFPDTKLAGQLWLRIGQANINIGTPARLDSAMVAFERALKAAPADSVRYRASLYRGRVLQLQGRGDEALKTYTNLLRRGEFRAWEGETRILIGRTYRERSNLTEALGEFERVRDDFPETAVAAMALYETGLLYLQDYGQRERAQEYFSEVTAEKRGSEADSLAKVVVATCSELDGLVEAIWLADSTAAALHEQHLAREAARMADAAPAATEPSAAMSDTASVDSSQTGATPPPRAARAPKLPAKLDGYLVSMTDDGQWDPIFPRPGWRDEEAAGNSGDRKQRRRPKRPSGNLTLEEQLYMVAEIYRDQLALPDSAAQVYQHLTNRFPSSDQRPRALYSLAWIHLEQRQDPPAARPYLERLVNEYGATAHANEARRQLGLPLVLTAEEQAATIFADIEQQARHAEDGGPWITRLDSLVERFPDTVTAARSAYLAAWVTENVIGDSAAAEARYDSVNKRFPRSAFADLVSERRRSQKDGLIARMERTLKTLGQALRTEEQLRLVAAQPDTADSVALSRKWIGFALRSHRHGDYQQAEVLYQSSLDERQGNNGDSYAGLGDVAWQQGYYEDAVEHMRRALKERANSALPYYRLFQYHVQRSQADSANRYLRNLTRRERDNPEVLSVIDRFPTVASAEPEPLDLDQLESIEVEPAPETFELPDAFFGVTEPPLVRSLEPARMPDGVVLEDSVAVLIDVLVNQQGKADSVLVYSGDGALAVEAVRAVRQYRFYPAENARKRPIDVWVEVAIPFLPAAVPPEQDVVTEAVPVTTQPEESPQ